MFESITIHDYSKLAQFAAGLGVLIKNYYAEGICKNIRSVDAYFSFQEILKNDQSHLKMIEL